ncbi:hypothetical protein TNCV_2541781 [Trichonephila clavipes]|nr:hypothetical protein TNCV_2541781 [Trichonephila clavipes]
MHLWISFTPNAAVLFVDLAIQPEVRFLAKQNSLMKIGNNDNLVLGPFDEYTPCLIIVLMNCQTKLRINHLTDVKSVAILEIGEPPPEAIIALNFRGMLSTSVSVNGQWYFLPLGIEKTCRLFHWFGMVAAPFNLPFQLAPEVFVRFKTGLWAGQFSRFTVMSSYQSMVDLAA